MLNNGTVVEVWGTVGGSGGGVVLPVLRSIYTGSPQYSLNHSRTRCGFLGINLILYKVDKIVDILKACSQIDVITEINSTLIKSKQPVLVAC